MPRYASPAAPACWAAMANSRPTLMPSGMLCKVTADTSRVVRFQLLLMPSGSSASMCRWGSRESSATRNATPSKKPPAAGIQPICPSSSACSMAGLSSDQTLAAIITPAAKPRKMWCMSLRSPRKKKTTAEPAVVISQVNPHPKAAHVSACTKFAGIMRPPFRISSRPSRARNPPGTGAGTRWLTKANQCVPASYPLFAGGARAKTPSTSLYN